jgi:hypothetical protein
LRRAKVEAFFILAVAAGLSAVVVWWATNQPGGRPRPKKPRTTSVGPVPPPVSSLTEELGTDRFVLLPTEPDGPPDDRPSPAVSLVRLAVTITFVAALGVGVLAVLGYLVKTQLDQYFTGL